MLKSQFPNETFEPICVKGIRKLAVESLCHRLKVDTTRAKNVPMVIDEEHKLAFCEISKAGSTNMKRVMALATKKGRKLRKNVERRWHNRHFLRELGIRTVYSNEIFLDGYTKFFIVRHPFDRLVSAYTDKVGPQSSGNGGYDMFSRLVLHINHPNASEADLDRMSKPSFKEFIHALVTSRDLLINNHWEAYALKYCDPCHIDYDHIMRIETMSFDFLPLTRMLRVKDTFAEEQRLKTYKSPRLKDAHVQVRNDSYVRLRRLEEFADVPAEEVQILEEYYNLEFQLFGYSFDQKNSMPGCQFEDTGCC